MLPQVNVYFIKNSKRLSQSRWVAGLNLLPEELHKNITRYYFWKDRQASLFGKLLLKLVFDQEIPQISLKDLNYNKFNKPFISDSLNFNISHSGSYVICAYTKLPEAIGIDIEHIKRNIEIIDFKNIFTQVEWDYVNNSLNPESAFFKLWTIKESIIKADGRGLQIPLESLKIGKGEAWLNHNRWHYRNIFIAKEYDCHLATRTKSYSIRKKEITIEELLLKQI